MTAALRKKLRQERKDLLAEASRMAERPNPTFAQDVELDDVLARAQKLDDRLKLLPKPTSKVSSIREPDIYRRGGEHSFFVDLLAAVSPTPVRHVSSSAASERLQRHQEHEERAAAIDGEVADRLASRHGITRTQRREPRQERALSTLTPAAGGVFSPPRWLVDEFASVVRSASPLRRLVTPLPLPPDCMELVIPRLDVAAGIVPESYENVDPTDAIDAPTDSITVPVVTFSASAQVSQQLYERGNFDVIASKDFGENYAAALELQLIDGSGVNGEMTGALNVSGTTLVTWTTASPTAPAAHLEVAQLVGQVGDTRKRPVEAILMRPSRYAWMAGSEDTAGDPLQRPGTGGPVSSKAKDGPYGPFVGVPVWQDAAIPNTLGAGANQDVILALRPSDWILLEDPPKFQAIVDSAVAAPQLAVSLVMHRYAAAFNELYPTGIGILAGTGLVSPPTGF